MDHRVIRDPSMPPPIGHYSQAVRVGDLLFVAGQPGVELDATNDPPTPRAVPGGFEAEARRAFANLEAVLRAAGSGLEHVVKTTTFITSVDDAAASNRIYAEFFPTDPPARSTPIVQLPRGLLFSIEAIAVIP